MVKPELKEAKLKVETPPPQRPTVDVCSTVVSSVVVDSWLVLGKLVVFGGAEAEFDETPVVGKVEGVREP